VEKLQQHIESLIFASESPITLDEIRKCLKEAYDTSFKKEVIASAIQGLMERYQDESFSIEILEIADGYQFMTKAAYHPIIGIHLRQTMRRRLSRSALETLSIIAYKQPVSKSDLEKIRGVSCDYSIQKLLEKELVTILGRAEGPGRPLLYGTSQKFLDYFGLKSVKDLPKIKDFKEPENAIGEKAPIEENVESENNEGNG
jgi:segregation and condensation protein B